MALNGEFHERLVEVIRVLILNFVRKQGKQNSWLKRFVLLKEYCINLVAVVLAYAISEKRKGLLFFFLEIKYSQKIWYGDFSTQFLRNFRDPDFPFLKGSGKYFGLRM